ncbi:MAG: hypothetical protein JXB49_14740 [Bacteroidales bacterium]|nr:hypothetical protein [Bacteroidales bacterium]
MKNTIILYARSLQCKLYGLVGLELEKSYNTIYLVNRDDEQSILEELKCKGRIYNLQDYIRRNFCNTSLLNNINLEEFEDDYDIASLWQIFYTDRFLNKYSLQDSERFMKLHIALFNELFFDNRPDILVNEEIALFSSYILFFYCQKHKSKYLGLSPPRHIGDKKVAFVHNDKNNYYLLDNLYALDNFSQDQLNEARQFIRLFAEQEMIPPYLLGGVFSKKEPDIIQSFLSLLKYFYSFIKRPEKADYTQYHIRHFYIRKAMFFPKYLIQKRYYQKPDYSKKYYYFPLHYQPEASTLVYAPNFEKQVYALDLIAKKIPIGSILYVKEHFSVIGHRSMSFYRALKKYPNVSMISPWESSHKLIKHSLGVITLTGTAGWEAILYGVPVFILGNVFYKSFKYANSIENINDLSYALKNSKTKNLEKEKYDLELLKYVSAYIFSSKDGICYLGSKELLDSKNVHSIYEAIVSQME